MPRIDFAPMTIRNLKPDSKTIEYFDKGREHGAGSFGLRISPRNKRTWFMMYKTEAGKIKRFTLGTYPKMSLKDARKMANDTMTRVNNGEDPMGDKVIHRSAPRMTDLWKEYQKALTNKARPKAATTISEEKRRWNNVINPAIGSMKVADVKPVHISSLLDKVAYKAPVSANRLYSLLQVIFKPALAKGWIEVHPLQWIDKPGGTEPPRKRILSDDEIAVLWPYINNLRLNPRDALKLGLLTAQRPGEILRMKWSDIDSAKTTWTIQNTKTGNDHLVPISPQVRQILKDREKGTNYSQKLQWMKDSQYVFPSRYNRKKGATSGHAKSTKNARKKLQKDSGVTGWTAHDLRRTARTIMSRLKIKHHIRERVLNHSQGGIQGVYDLHDYLQEKSDALNKLANEIDRILGVEKSAKIIQLKTA